MIFESAIAGVLGVVRIAEMFKGSGKEKSDKAMETIDGSPSIDVNDKDFRDWVEHDLIPCLVRGLHKSSDFTRSRNV